MEKNYAKIVFQGSGIIFTVTITGMFLGYVLRMFLSRELSVHEFGLFYALLAFVSLFSFFRDLGFTQSLVRHIPEFVFKKQFTELKTAIWFVSTVQIIASIIVMLPIVVFSDFFATNFFHTMSASIPLKILTVSFILSTIIGIYRSIFQGHQKIKYIPFPEFLRTMLVLLFTVLLIRSKIIGVALSYTLSAVIVSVVFFPQVYKLIKPLLPYKTNMRSHVPKKIFYFAIPVFFGGIATTTISTTDTLMITYFRTLYDVGVYQIALVVSQILWLVIGAVSPILFPVVSELWASNKSNYLSVFISSLLKFLFLVALPLAVIFISFSGSIIFLFFTEKYLSSTTPLQILCISSLFYILSMFYSTLISAMGKPMFVTKTSITMVGTNFLLNLFIIPTIGIMGAAITSLISYTIGFIILSFYLKRLICYSLPLASWFRIIIISLLLLGYVSILKSVIQYEPLITFIIILLTSLPFFTVLLRISKIISKDDMIALKKIMPPRLYSILDMILSS